jgi:single-stranded-DNA-specific exonuclease
VASRLVDKFYRPTVIVNLAQETSGHAQGSARSIPGFCLLSAIRACADHCVTFGGHTMAAGLTIKTGRLEVFASDFEAYAREHLHDDDVTAKLTIDALMSLRPFSMDMVRQLQRLGPFGRGNPKPVFATQGVRLLESPRRVGARGDHLQLAVTDNNQAVRCIGFGMGHLEKKLLEVDGFDIAYEAQINTYNGNSSVQFSLIDVQCD